MEHLLDHVDSRRSFGQWKLAKEDYDALIEFEPDNAVAFCRRGPSLAQLGDPTWDVEGFDKAIVLKPSDAIPSYNQRCTYAEMGDLRRVLEDLNRAIALDPGNQTLLLRAPARLRQYDLHAAGDRPRQPGDVPHFPTGEDHAIEPLDHLVIIDTRCKGTPRTSSATDQQARSAAPAARRSLRRRAPGRSPPTALVRP